MVTSSFLSQLILPKHLLSQQRSGIADTDAGAYRVVRVLEQWEPEEPIWRQLGHAYSAALKVLSSPTRTHYSAIRPSGDSAYFGSTGEFPLASALAGGIHVPADSTWDLVATLVAAPHFKQQIGLQGQPLEQSGPLLVWLRNAHRAGRLALMREGLKDARSPLEVLNLMPDGISPSASTLQRQLIDAARGFMSAPGVERPVENSDAPAVGGVVRRIKNTALDPLDSGLAPEDMGTIELSVPGAIGDDGEVSEAARDAARVGTAIAHAQLPLQVGYATPEEVRHARDAIAERLSGDLDVGALGLGLAMISGCDLLDLALAPIHESSQEAIAHLARGPCAFTYENGRNLLLSRVRRPQQAYSRPETAGESFKPYATFVAHEMPPALAKHLPRRKVACLAAWQPSFVDATRAFAQRLRQDTLGRQHLGRMRRALCAPLFSATRDECTLQLVLPGAQVLAGAGSYYSGISLGTAFDLHRHAAGQLFPYHHADRPAFVETLRETSIGSEVALDVERLATELSNFRYDVESAVKGRRTPEAMAHSLTQLSLYTSAVIHVTTGHRPREEGIGTWAALSENLEWLSVSDKCFSARTRQRIVPLPAVAVEQLKNFRSSVQVAADVLGKTDKAAARVLGKSLEPGCLALPLFSVCNGVWSTETAGAKSWQKMLPSWSVPINAHRHVLVQALQGIGVPRELISYLLGHAEPGQELFAHTCSNVPAYALSQVKKALESYAETLRIAPARALRPYTRKCTKAPRGRISCSRSKVDQAA